MWQGVIGSRGATACCPCRGVPVRSGVITSATIVAALLSAPVTTARSNRPHRITLDDRIQAQRSIDRVLYSHQIGATKPFETAVPREVLERKVRTYLKQSVALEEFWKTPVT